MPYEVVSGFDVRVEKAGDILLQEVRIAHEHAPYLQVDNEGGEQLFCPPGLHGDYRQPGAYVFYMGRVHPDLPFSGRSRHVRVFEAEPYQLVDEGLDQRVVVLVEDFSRNGGDARDDGVPVGMP